MVLRFKFLFILVFITFNLFSQDSDNILEHQVSISFDNVPVEIILNSISQQSGSVFSYNSKLVDTKKYFSIHVSNVSIREALFIIFEHSIIFTTKGKYIILTKPKENKKKSDNDKIIVEGYILNNDSTGKLQNVTVYDKDQLISTTTDQYGYFKIELSPAKSITQLKVSKLGYADTIISPVQIKSGFVKINMPKKQNNKFNNEFADSLRVKVPRWLLSKTQKINSLNINDSIFRKVQISFVPFISTNLMLGGSAINDYSFNIIGGYVKGVRKFEVGGIFNIDRGDVQYAQLAGCINLVLGNVNGFQYAGIINIAKNVNGGQVAGWMNINYGNGKYVQFAGIGNFCLGSYNGFQSAGIYSISRNLKGAQLNGILSAAKNVDGSQISGIVSVADTIKGTQVSGISNFSRSFKGVQVASISNLSGVASGFQIGGITNVSYDTATNQIASIANVAKVSNGFQMALVNIADTSSGVPIGLFSYVRKGYHRFEFSIDELRFVNFSFRTGVNYLYNIFSAGIQLNKFDYIVWNYKLGLGAFIPINTNYKHNFEASINNIVYNTTFSDYAEMYTLYYGIDKKIGKKTTLDFGVTYNFLSLNTQEKNYYNKIEKISPYYLSTTVEKNGNVVKDWIGVRLAIRF
jgi:hypothetical protein